MNPRDFFNGKRGHWLEKEMTSGVGLGWSGGLFGFTCMLGRGRGRVPAQDLRSSSRARLSISNCLSCSRTEASREAVLAHCSIHTLRAEQSTGQDRNQHPGAGDSQPTPGINQRGTHISRMNHQSR